MDLPDDDRVECENQTESLSLPDKSGLALFVLHKFVEVDVPQSTAFEELSLMEDSGCFHLPPRPVLDQFMKQYFLYVYPFLPLIDEGVFWDTYSSQVDTDSGSRRKYPLCLIQAMLFMACPVCQLKKSFNLVSGCMTDIPMTHISSFRLRHSAQSDYRRCARHEQPFI
jgi:hypothetical protein